MLVNGAVLVGKEVGCAVALGGLNADGARAHGDDARSTVQSRTGNAHKTNRSDADDEYRIAELNAGQLNGMESGGNHVGENAGICGIHAFGHVSQVAVGVVYVEVLGKDAVFEVGEFPTGKHTAGVHGISGLCLKGVPVGSNGGNKDAVARLKVLDKLANLNDFGGAFVAQNHVVAIPDGAFPKRVHI